MAGETDLLDVLVVDDEEGILRAVSRTLAGASDGEPLSVATTLRPADALEILARRPVKVLVTDFRMPEMDGCELLREAKRVSPDTIRLMLTGQADMDDLIDAINAGRIFRYLAKPWENGPFRRAIREAVDAWSAAMRRRDEFHEVDHERRALQAAVAIVSDMQRSLLPDGADEVVGADVAYSFTPCEHASGDYVDTIPLPDGRTAVVIGDVCGHGLGAALFVFTARALLRSGLREGQELSRVVARTNRFLCEDMAAGRFLTMFCGIHDAARGRLEYLNAGHHPAVVLGGDVDPLRRTAIPLGVMEDADYGDVRQVALHPGQTLFAFTDGVVEARRGDDELFGTPRLMEVVERHAALGPGALLERVRDAIGEFTGGAADGQDDITLFAYRPVARPAAVRA